MNQNEFIVSRVKPTTANFLVIYVNLNVLSGANFLKPNFEKVFKGSVHFIFASLVSIFTREHL